MKVRYLFLFFVALVIGVSSCKKNSSVDPQIQLGIDTNLIKEYLVKNNITAKRHATGVYYQIITPGTGTVAYTLNTSISALYTGRLLNGTIFDSATTNPISFKLGGVIQGWQIGIPLIQKGGKIRLLIPSGYGYGDMDAGRIPANSVLDFEVELVDVQN
jgi:FKBP-type peptidyl-prolyl cis-trans isomerase FkpA